MLIWFLLFLRRFDRKPQVTSYIQHNSLTKKHTNVKKNVFVYIFIWAVCVPICFIRLFTLRGTGEAESQLLQPDNFSDVVAFYGMMDWPYRWPFWQSWQTKGGDQIYAFVLISSDILSLSELDGIQPQTSHPERRRHAMRLQVIFSTQLPMSHLGTKHLSPWLPV